MKTQAAIVISIVKSAFMRWRFESKGKRYVCLSRHMWIVAVKTPLNRVITCVTK